MTVTQIDPRMISLNNLNDLRRTAATNDVSSSGNASPAETVDSTPEADSAIMYHSHLRAKVRMMADANNEIIGRHDQNRTYLNALHQIKMLLKKTSKMLSKFGSGNFITEKPGLLQHKIEKLIAKLNRIAERANIDIEDIEDPIPPELTPTEEPVPSAPIVGAGSLTPPEPETTPDVSNPSDVISPTDTAIPPDDTTPTDGTTPVVAPTDDGLPSDDSPADLPALKNGLIFTIDSSLTRIVDMENNFLLEQYKLEGSLTYFGNPIDGTSTGLPDTPSFTNIEFMLETTRMQMLSDSGKTIYAQTMSLSLDIVSLLN